MARFRSMKNKMVVAKPPVVKKQPDADQVTGDKIPKSFVFCRGKLPGSIKQLELDLRKLMLPYTALKLRENKRNDLKDFLNVAGPDGRHSFSNTIDSEERPPSSRREDASRPDACLSNL